MVMDRSIEQTHMTTYGDGVRKKWEGEAVEVAGSVREGNDDDANGNI